MCNFYLQNFLQFLNHVFIYSQSEWEWKILQMDTFLVDDMCPPRSDLKPLSGSSSQDIMCHSLSLIVQGTV